MLSPVDIQHHLYSSFLDGRTADVALHVRGTWNAIYKLHRVVLIQSGYFKSLFTAGFAESSPRLGGHLRGPDELDLVLDDQNITRAAFEICIAHLYGGGPSLTLPPFLVPTQLNPLSSSFPIASKPSVLAATPEGHHPVTPRFLLSLLATSLFLSIPTLASDALSMILNSVGPWTVVGYLRFAIGKGIGWNGEWGEWDSEEKQAAVGLENVAALIGDEQDSSDVKDVKGDVADAETDLSNRLADTQINDLPSPHSSSASLESPIEKHGVHVTPEPYLYYGAVSDKIGQAVVCWLARWGVDLFLYEVKKDMPSGDKNTTRSPADRLFTRSIAHLRQRAMSVPENRPSSAPSSPSALSTFRPSDKAEDPLVPVIWGVKGLEATWVAALLSADTIFVKGERERYDLAAAVVEMRRRQGGVVAEEEAVWKGLFEQGIYYVNMSVEDIMHIAQDVSPATGRPYVSLRILQAAHWDQAMLRQRILSTPSLSSSLLTGSASSPSPKDIGVALSTADILGQSPTPQEDSITEIRYYHVHSDSSMRLGDTGGLSPDITANGGKGEPITMEQLYAFASGETNTVIASASGDHRSVPLSPTRSGESTFFGLHTYSYKDLGLPPKTAYPIPIPLTPSQVPRLDTANKLRWSPYPPYRFAVEFWDIDWLKEKSRLHSHTIWYAGSLFNVYVQVVWKKGNGTPATGNQNTLQVGVYLHRQSSVEAVPSCSRPSSELIAQRTSEEREMRHVRGPSMPALSASPSRTSHYSPSIHPPSRSTTPNPPSAPSSPIISNSPPNSSLGMSASSSQLTSSYSSVPGIALPAIVPSVAPPQPFRDPRSSVKAYFTICCASGTGTAQTRFSSAPDDFAISQSWGWKSSSLTLRVGSGPNSGASGDTFANKPVIGKNDEVSLRATVILGIV